MNFNDYTKSGFDRYQRLAKVVQKILTQALNESGRLANAPQVQSRAKSPVSLQRKIAKRGLGDDNLEAFKDLAGCRIIFYTETDLDRFRQSSFWRENFDIDYDASRLHFPKDANASADELYQGVHYVVSLKDERTKLLEYAEFKGLRCEVQLQSILNHAWSETSHDVIYKPDVVNGFGKRQLEELNERFAKVMRDYLIPAGYELQKLQSSAERLRAGLSVFNSEPLTLLSKAADNNERVDLLQKIGDYFLSGVDELSVYVGDVRSSVVTAVESARATPVTARDGLFGGFRGATSLDVTRQGCDILDNVRYWYVEDAFAALARLWEGTSDIKELQRIEESLQRLSKYSLPIWKQAGAGVQLTLLSEVRKLNEDRRKKLRPLILKVCEAVFDQEMEHSEATSVDTITFTRAKVPAHQTVVEARAQALEFALEAFRDTIPTADWRKAWNVLWHGTYGSADSDEDEKSRQLRLDQINLLCGEVEQARSQLTFEALQEIEEALYWAHRRFGVHCSNEEGAIAASIASTKQRLVLCRDVLNSDESYVKYKTLVGFRTVFPEEWDAELSYDQKEKCRTDRIDAYVDAISDATLADWVSLVVACAETDSNDGATFPPFINFLKTLSAKKPAIALQLFTWAGVPVERFAPAMFPVIMQSDVSADALKVMQSWIGDGRNLASLGRILILCDEPPIELIADLKTIALADESHELAWEVAHAALKHGKKHGALWEEVFPAVTDALTKSGRGSVASSYMISDEDEALFEKLPQVAMSSLIHNFIACGKIGYLEQRRLSRLFKLEPELVWGMFAERLEFSASRSSEDGYEVFPEHWHGQGLEAQLKENVVETYDRVRSWPEKQELIDRWRKATFFAKLYGDCGQQFVDALLVIIRREEFSEYAYLCDVLSEFDGNELLAPVCQELIIVAKGDEQALADVERVLFSTGVVSGEFGMAEAYEAKAAHLETWLQHPESRVQEFARGAIQRFGKMALDDQRRATQRRELRKRDFDGDVDGDR